MNTVDLIVTFTVSMFSLLCRLAQRKFDKTALNLAAATALSALVIYIRAVEGLVKAAYASYNAGKALRKALSAAGQPSPTQTGVEVKLLEGFQKAECLPEAKTEIKFLEGFQPFGYLPEAKTKVKLLESFQKVESLPEAKKPVLEIEKLKMVELKKLAKELGLKNYSRLKKAQLVQVIEEFLETNG